VRLAFGNLQHGLCHVRRADPPLNADALCSKTSDRSRSRRYIKYMLAGPEPDLIKEQVRPWLKKPWHKKFIIGLRD